VNGVLVVDKERGPTSHDIVARVRKRLHTREVGHAGTLDPMATGVLVVAVGEATKLVPYLTAEDKAYEATILLGIETDTLDADGKETRRVPVPSDLVSRLHAALDGERERILQVPPAYSAIKVDGQRAHELARQGRPPELAAREVAVRSLEVDNIHFETDGDAGHLPAGIAEIKVALEVTKGYFVRSLARDLAAALGTVGHLTALRRTRSGRFTLADATDDLIPIDVAAARALPISRLTELGVVMAGHGKKIPPSELSDPHARPSAWLDPNGRLVAVGEVLEDGTGRVLRGFPPS
jgi:tRNA pseudouridine55 synthase